jgi:hypothetical protein
MIETEGFFARLCARLAPDERVTIWTLPRRKSEHLPPDPALLARRAIELDAGGTEGVFFGVCPRASDLGEHRRGGLVDVSRVQALWVDIDVAHATHAAKNLPPGTLEAASLLAGLPDPTMVVWSGGGLHAYWVLDEPLSREAGARACEGLQAIVRAAAAQRGWHLDATANPDRVLRVPGTTNRKDPEDPRPCTVIDETGRTYSYEEIASALGGSASASAPARAQAAGNGGSPSTSSPPHGDAGPPSTPASRAAAREATLRALAGVHNERTVSLARAILQGLPLQAGQRDTDLTRMTGIISMVCPPESRAEDLVELLYPVIDATAAQGDDPKNPAPTRKGALDKLQRSMRSANKKRAQEAADRDTLSRGLIRAARASAAPPPVDSEEEEEVSDRPYSAEEIRLFEAEHGIPLQWIVQFQGSYYVLVGGKYQGPVVQSDLAVNFRRTLAPAPLDLTTWDNGQPRPMTTPEILERHSTDATRVVADLTISASVWDRGERVFREACAPLRRITPAYDDLIHRWLMLLGGARAHELMDWVASVTRLEHQCAALYLTGQPGSGKTMLAAGLARLWGASWTSLENVVGPWTADLARCPLVVADEHLPPTWARSQTASAELRQLIGSSSRPLTRKFLPNADLSGALRLVLIANDRSMLPTDESLGANDLEAIGGRFLHIPTTLAAKQYIDGLGGKSGRTRDWVSGDKIAAHALWLRDNRAVEPGNRFLVEGDTKGVKEDLVIDTRIGSLVCEVIVRTLSDSRPMQGAAPAVRAGNKRLLVSGAGIADQWEHCIQSDSVASTQKIGRQLKLMSGGHIEHVRGVPYHVVRPEYVLRWAERYAVGDVELMRAKIEGTVLDIHDGGVKK